MLTQSNITTAKFDAYIVCTSPRSGSTLLCHLLKATTVAGIPASYFHRPSVSSWASHFNLKMSASKPESAQLASIFKAAIYEGSLDTGMFGLRLQQHSFDYFREKLAILYPELPYDAQRLNAAFGRTAFLYLTRDEKLDQAISYVRAEQSGLWHMAEDGSELERLSAPQPLQYDANRIRAALEKANAQDHQWKRWFAAEGIEPLRITYAALSSDPIGTLNKTLSYLGLNYRAANDLQPGVAKMADGLSAEWAARFRSEST